jgi:hypothetical protein
MNNIEGRHIEMKKAGGYLDGEFNYIETVEGLSLQERAQLIRALLDEMEWGHGNMLDKQMKKNNDALVSGNKPDGHNIRHFLLPHVPHWAIDKQRKGVWVEENLLETREYNDDDRAEYSIATTQEHKFFWVDQGAMWAVKTKENPYAKFSITECSVIVGKKDDEIVIAHISYSNLYETQKVLEFLKTEGVNEKDIYALARVREGQKERRDEWEYNFLGKRAYSVKQYEELGIPSGNIHPFDLGHSQACELIISKDMLYAYAVELDDDGKKKYTQSVDQKQGITTRAYAYGPDEWLLDLRGK